MAPRTRSSTLRQSGPTAAQSLQTKPTATVTATPTATPRRRQRPKKESGPSNAASGAVKKPEKPPERASRRIQKLPVEYSKLVDTPRRRKQEQSAAPQHEATLPPKSPELAPHSSQRLPSQHNLPSAPTSTQQDPERQRNRHPNDTAGVSTGDRQEQPNEPTLEHTLSNHPVQSWLLATEPIPPPEDVMAGPSNAKGKGKRLHDQVVTDNATRSQSGTTPTGDSTPDSVDSDSTVKKNAPWKKKEYRDILEEGTEDGVSLIMEEVKDRVSDGGLSKERTALLKDLMHTRREDQKDARFKHEVFERLLSRLHMQNERGVSHELHGVLCPSAGILGDLNFEDETLRETYDNLVNQWDESWSQQPAILERFKTAKPDYCVGFFWKAFRDDQRKKLKLISSEGTTVMPTTRMYFPFLTCEVKAPLQPLEAAENQNGYSMLATIRSLVKLFRAAKREHTCSGHIMAFSMSYNHAQVLIFAYYPIVDGEKTKIFRRRVYRYSLSPDDTEDTAQAWNFIRNVYEIWSPKHLRRIREAIDAIDFNTPVPNTQNVPASLAQINDQNPTAPRHPDAMSVDNDSAAASASENQGSRPAPEQHTEQPSPKRTRR